jgi:hypothetical protein
MENFEMIKKLFATSVLAMGTLIGASTADARLVFNALSFNALNWNGLGFNGLHVNGFSSEETHLLPLSELAKDSIVETASE